MANYIDSFTDGETLRDFLGVDGDRTYEGLNLTEKFQDEIAAAPYNGNPWAWIKARITARNFSGIHVCDYIPFTADSKTFNAQVAGINTYRNYGDTAVGRHIDFICKELWHNLKPINPFNYNNGLIPVENVTSDGESLTYTLTKEMNAVNTITMNGEGLSGYSYDPATYTITFEEAPAAGTMTVTGTGTEYPWLASDLYHWLNSLSGQIPNGTGLNPAVKHVDYSATGVYDKLPAELKAVIIEKRMLLGKRYSATGVLSNPNSWGWESIGKLWLPTECEVYGQGVWANTAYDMGGSAVQYPVFAGNMNRVKNRNGSRYLWWLLVPTSGTATNWCYVSNRGAAAANNASSTYVAAPVCFRVG